MNGKIAAALLALVATTPAGAEDFGQPNDQIFHYSVMDAMRNGVYRGTLRVGDLKGVGDMGLGTFNHLDGELVGIDGVFYRVAPDGSVAAAEADRKIPFGGFAFFKEDKGVSLATTGSFEDMQNDVIAALPSRNRLYAVRISGTFAEVSAGGANKIEDGDRTPIAKLMEQRPIYTRQNVRGTVIGFYHPPYVGGVDLLPFHLHFISEDRSFGGHVTGMKLDGAPLQVSLDEKKGIDVELPPHADFTGPWSTSPTSQKGY
jgi:acetolactate decarboxylase